MLSPLLSVDRDDAIVAWRDGQAVRVADFLAEAWRVVEALPAGGQVLNFCKDRYHFAVGFAAAVLADKLTLLPSTRTPEVLDQLRQTRPGLFVLSDAPPDCALPHVAYPAPVPGEAPASTSAMPMIDDARVVAEVFTSGSTGAPKPHAKTWGNLVRCIHAGVESLGLAQFDHLTLVGTVPAQHMYGFESTVLLALHGGIAMSAEHPFYPADIVAALAAVPAPRLLVSTPVHLRALLAADLPLPPVAAILCATAPLSVSLAHEIESRFAAPLLEIYGATETGQIATRRTTETDRWTLFPGIRLQTDGEDGWIASGGHVSGHKPLSDMLELDDDRLFRLLGRHTDMVNIAGKRSSLSYLNHQLCGIPGVLDGAFFQPDDTGAAVSRLIAFVVAPTLDKARIIEALRQRIDPAFMPRPLILIDALPRNATGKLPHGELSKLAARHLTADTEGSRRMTTQPLSPYPDDHPAFAGHFPGHPIVPGVLLLDAAVHAAGFDHAPCKVASSKFLRPVAPGEALQLDLETSANGTVRFTLRHGDGAVASGQLQSMATPTA